MSNTVFDTFEEAQERWRNLTYAINAVEDHEPKAKYVVVHLLGKWIVARVDPNTGALTGFPI